MMTPPLLGVKPLQAAQLMNTRNTQETHMHIRVCEYTQYEYTQYEYTQYTLIVCQQTVVTAASLDRWRQREQSFMIRLPPQLYHQREHTHTLI